MRLDDDQRRMILSDPAGWIASGFGAGLSPVVSGTVGSAVALLPYLALRLLSTPMYLLVVAVAFALGIWVSAIIVQRLGVADPGVIVWDEFVGQWITLAFAPFEWRWIVVGFFLFRLFDVWKPWPVSWADRRLKGGLGVMLDDVFAGVYAAIVLAVLVYLV
ncbi:MAG: phosphatidylglycerophosphatase A [Rhodanobacteraceae bacterium]